MKGERHLPEVRLREEGGGVPAELRLCIDVAALVARHLLVIVNVAQLAVINFHIWREGKLNKKVRREVSRHGSHAGSHTK